MSTEIKKYWSVDAENYEYDSLGDLLNANDLTVGDIAYVADAIPVQVSELIDVDDILECLSEHAYEIAGEATEDYPDVSKQAQQQLQDLLEAWVTEHCPPNFYTVARSEQYIITSEDIDI
jgi:hypothetical protein